jgi:uncharacterized protein (DUF58 family)
MRVRGMRPPLIEAPASAFLIFIVQVFMFFCLFFALLYDVAELTLFALIVLAMGLGSYLWSRASLNHVECKIALNRTRLFPGERLKIYIQVINSKLLPLLFKVDFFAPKAIVGSDTGQWISAETGLLWYQQYVFSREFLPNKRGVYDLGPPMLRGGDLFGFFFRNKKIKDRFEIVVYPRIVNIRPIPLSKREFYGIPGTQSPVEDPVFVFGTRDYQPGRPARRIHWKASSRYNRLLEKLCEPAEQEKVLILLDVDQFDHEQAKEDFERSLEVIASLILQMDRRGIAVGFATNGNILRGGSRIIPISRSPLQMASILEVLARMGAEKAGRVTDILSRGYKIPGGVSSIYFAYGRCDLTRFAKAFLKNRNTPVRFVMAQKSNDVEITDDPQEKDTFYLDNILVPENRKR